MRIFKTYAHGKRLLFGAIVFTIPIVLAAQQVDVRSVPGLSGAGRTVPDHYIVRVRENVDTDALVQAYGISPRFVYRKAVRGFAGRIPPGTLRRLENDVRVRDIVADRVVGIAAKPDRPGKPGGGGGGGGGNDNEAVPAGVSRIGAEPAAGLGVTGQGIGVAVVDSGLDAAHRDLLVSGSGFYSPYVGSSTQDENGHGTHVGGTIAAKANGLDVVGVAPGATLYAVRVLNAAGQGDDSDVIAGLEWILANAASVQPPIKAVNMSLGRPGSLNDNPSLRAAIAALHGAGIAIAVAAGNECGLEVSGQIPSTYPEVIAVASTAAENGGSKLKGFSGIPADTASFFTTDGAWNQASGIGVTVSAPGETKEDVNGGGLIRPVGILSTKLGGGTTRLYGTSMASPHVAGILALLYEQAGGSLAPEAARGKIVSGADLVGTAPLDSPTSCYSYDGDREGVVSAAGALAAP
ncbi:MAG: S8 family serine peptidase [Lentisphaerae bacterium]|nr:S8 family serine peptidase [Lentisphaerota bacterium]